MLNFIRSMFGRPKRTTTSTGTTVVHFGKIDKDKELIETPYGVREKDFLWLAEFVDGLDLTPLPKGERWAVRGFGADGDLLWESTHPTLKGAKGRAKKALDNYAFGSGYDPEDVTRTESTCEIRARAFADVREGAAARIRVEPDDYT